MVESILGKYIDIVKENEKESAEDYAVYLTELDVIKSVENNGRELSSIEVNIKLRLNHQIALVKGLMVQGSILEREVRTYEELEEFVSNYENQEQELDVYGVIMGELDSIFDETLDFGYDFGYEDIDLETIRTDGHLHKLLKLRITQELEKVPLPYQVLRAA